MFSLDKNKLNHFYIFIGDTKKNQQEVLSILKRDIDFDYKKNPDFFNFFGEKLLIDLTRKIKQINSTAFIKEKSYRVFFLNFEKISIDSQNALLKTLEEPQENTIFFLFVYTDEFLLDTIISRAILVKNNTIVENVEGQKFLAMNFLERMGYLNQTKDDLDINYFLNSLESALYGEKGEIENFFNLIKTFLELKEQSNFPGSNRKYILEFFAFYLPRIKY